MKLINRLEGILIGLLLVSITLLVFVEVVLRFAFNTGLHWGQEVTLLLSAWMILLGGAWAVREQAHICVDALVERVSPKLKKLMLILAVALSLLYCGIFFYGSWVYLGKMKMIGIELDDIAMPRWIAESVLLIGFGLLALRLTELGYKIWRGEAHGFHVHHNAMTEEQLAEDKA